MEDNPAILDILTVLLEGEGFEVIGTGDGADAERLARTLVPDLAILDLMLPGLSGGEIARRLRQSACTRHVKIAYISALTPEDAERQGWNVARPDLFISKPFDIHDLVERIRALLGPAIWKEAGSA